MPEEPKFRINAKVTINKPGHRSHGLKGLVWQADHKGQMVYTVRLPAPNNTYLGDFLYEHLTKGWNS